MGVPFLSVGSMDRIETLIERVLFASRWVLVPLYLGLAAFLLDWWPAMITEAACAHRGGS